MVPSVTIHDTYEGGHLAQYPSSFDPMVPWATWRASHAFAFHFLSHFHCIKGRILYYKWEISMLVLGYFGFVID